jgi:hypothetical protein
MQEVPNPGLVASVGSVGRNGLKKGPKGVWVADCSPGCACQGNKPVVQFRGGRGDYRLETGLVGVV